MKQNHNNYGTDENIQMKRQDDEYESQTAM